MFEDALLSWNGQRMLDYIEYKQMAFHQCVFSCDLEVAKDEKRLYHKRGIYMEVYEFECAF